MRHADVGANAAIHAGFDAQVQNALDFGVQHITRGSKAGDAVAHHAAQFGALVKQGHVVALKCQLVGRRQACGAAADDGHGLAGHGGGLGVGQLVGNGVVAQKMLYRIDADKIFKLVAVAARLTRRRAHAPHDRGKWVGFGQAAKGIFLPHHAGRRFLDATHDIEVTTDVFTCGATALARRCALNVGRALVRVTGIKDFFLPGAVLGFAIFVAAKA